MTTRTYRELRRIESFKDRYNYLSLGGSVGQSTFGFDRYLNQRFYKSREWLDVRRFVIARDNGCDLGVPEYEIHHGILVHHMNPVTIQEVTHGHDSIFDPDFLITTTQRTHNAIHYGDESLLAKSHVPRGRGDTDLWKRGARHG
jgi:hypothetical protein